MKCRHLPCNWNTSNILLLERHEKRYPKISRSEPNCDVIQSELVRLPSIIKPEKDAEEERRVECNAKDLLEKSPNMKDFAEVRTNVPHKEERMGLLLQEVGQKTSRKLAEDIIQLLNDEFPLESFKRQFQSFRDSQALSNALLMSNKSALLFQKRSIKIGELECEFYYRCPIKQA